MRPLFWLIFLRHIFFPLAPQAKLFLGKGTIGKFLEKKTMPFQLSQKNGLPFCYLLGTQKGVGFGVSGPTMIKLFFILLVMIFLSLDLKNLVKDYKKMLGKTIRGIYFILKWIPRPICMIKPFLHQNQKNSLLKTQGLS